MYIIKNKGFLSFKLYFKLFHYSHQICKLIANRIRAKSADALQESLLDNSLFTNGFDSGNDVTVSWCIDEHTVGTFGISIVGDGGSGHLDEHGEDDGNFHCCSLS